MKRRVSTTDGENLHDVQAEGTLISRLALLSMYPLTKRLQWTWLTFFLIFEIGSLICGVATSSAMLIVGRAIAGLGTSGILNGALLIVAECAPMQRRPSTNLSCTGFERSIC